MTHPHFPGNRTAPRSARSPPLRAGTWRPFCARRNSTAACCGREDRRRVDWRSTCTRRQRRSWVWRVQHVGTRSGIFLHMFASLTCWKYELEVVRLVVWQKNEGGPHNLLLVLLYIYIHIWLGNQWTPIMSSGFRFVFDCQLLPLNATERLRRTATRGLLHDGNYLNAMSAGMPLQCLGESTSGLFLSSE